MRPLIFAVFCLAPLAGQSAETWRTFTDTRGRTMVAKILRVEARMVVVELKADGRQLPINFENLSDEDVEFLRSYDPEESTPGNPAPNKTADDAVPEGEPEAGRLYPLTKEQIRSGIREIENRKRLEGISKEIHDATQRLNVYRFLCGVPYEVEPDADFSSRAEEAAIACKNHGSLSHDLGQSTDKCNLTTLGDMVDSVGQYIEDSGENNRDARGHRAWCLNPPMQKVGFGSAGGSYSAMWCMDSSGKSARGTWSYPGKGLFPLDYMHGTAWSLYGAGKPDSADKVKIQVFRLLERPEKPFSATEEIPGREMKINHVSLAMNGINFEPEEPAKRGVYWVRIRGGGIREGYLVELYQRRTIRLLRAPLN